MKSKIILAAFAVIAASSPYDAIADQGTKTGDASGATTNQEVTKTESPRAKRRRAHAKKTLLEQPERITGSSVGKNAGGPSGAGAGD